MRHVTNSTRRAIAIVAAAAIVASAVGVTASIASAPSEPGLAGWPRQFGTTAADHAEAVAAVRTGEVYLAVETFGSAPGFSSAGGADVALVKYDRNGHQKWVRQFGTPSGDAPIGVAASRTGDIYIVGSTNGALTSVPNAGNSDVFIAKFDRNGNQKWIRQFGTSEADVGFGVAVSAAGDAYVGGYTTAALPGNVYAAGEDGFIAKYDRNGNRKWIREFGGSGADCVYSLGVSAAGDVYAAGVTNSPGFASTELGDYDGFLMKLDRNGTLKWSQRVGSDGSDGAYSVAVSPAGDSYVVGGTEGTLPGQSSAGLGDVFAARFDRNGNEKWAHQFGTSANESNLARASVAISGSAVYIVADTAGSFPGFNLSGSTDVALAKLSASTGNEVWIRQFGTDGAGDEAPVGIATRGSDSNGGGVVIAGFTSGTVWGQVNYGDEDSFVATFPR